MKDLGSELAEQVERALRDASSSAKVLADLGIEQALVSEAAGGLGLGWLDLADTLAVWGRCAGDETLASILVSSWVAGIESDSDTDKLREAGMAVALAAQIGGALQGALDLAVEYVTTREQFGRPLSKFQAIQMLAADLALETAAARSAANLGLAWLSDDPMLAASLAKCRASRAAGRGAAAAHQMHGAIGVTEEYPLHRLTACLWRWRDMTGGETKWAAVMGERFAEVRGDSTWSRLVEALDGGRA